jgi:hypothetical protein
MTLPRRLEAVLDAPPRAFSPVALWWWSGEPLVRERLRWQLERFMEGGVYNLVVIDLAPSGPLYGSDADEPPFFSEPWWELLSGTCDDARELGVSLWLYDQLGFSGANLQGRLVSERPEFAGRRLERAFADLDGPGVVRCPPQGVPIAAAAVPLDRAGPPVAVAVEGREARWSGRGRHRLMLFYAVVRGFDYLSAEACAALIDRVHGEYARRLGDHIGTTVVGTFQDELPSMPTWSAGFADEFAHRCGYDVVPLLAALWEDLGAETRRVRRDFHATRAALCEAAFFRPLFAWHEARGLLCGCDQQDPARAGHPVATVREYADYARTHRWFGAPGSDHHGDARLHSSLAHLYGRPRTWIEAFHSTGWGGTLEETLDWLLPWLRAGATLYNPHAVYYSTRGGWWEWAPPATDWRQPYWRHHRVFAAAVARLCAALSLGRHVCDVGVLFPTTTVQAGTGLDGTTAAAERAHETYLELIGDMTWFRVAPGVLDRLRCDFDVLDDDSIQAGRVEDGRLRIRDEAYATVILPACTELEDATAERLCELAGAGGRVVAVGAVDDRLAGRAVHVAAPEGLAAALSDASPTVEAPVPALVREVDGTLLVLLTAAFPRATQARVARPDERGVELGWVDAEYDFDPGAYARTMRVRVRGASAAPVLIEPFGGTRRTLPASADAAGVTVDVPFDDGPVVLLAFPPGGEPAAAPGGEAGDVRGLGDEWAVELVPTVDERWGDFAGGALERWELAHRTELPSDDGRRDGWAEPDHDDAAWATVRATFGPRALWTGPAAPARLPPPEAPWRDGRPARWSPSRGIERDPIHRATLGPKGHVPEEFVDFGTVPAGEAVQVACAIALVEDVEAHLAVGAAASKRAWVDGREVELDDGGYLAVRPVRLEAGGHVLVLRFEAEEEIALRAHFALVRDVAAYRRPEWIEPADAPGSGGLVVFRAPLELPAAPSQAVLQVGATGSCRVLVNGADVARQGGFDPYAEHQQARLGRHDVTSLLSPGPNLVQLHVAEAGVPAAVLVDAVATCGGRDVLLMSDRSWEVEREGARVATVARRRQWGDPAWAHLRRRPHPLPGAAWLEGAQGDVVVPLATSVPGAPGVEWLRWRVPPGATEMRLTLGTEGTVYVDGRERAGGQGPLVVALDRAARSVAVRAETTGREEGALLDGPVQFTPGPGTMRLGDWEEQGLRGYSGGVRYRRTVAVEGGGHVLDLGRVRGTAEVRVNGASAGVRVCSPYVFDLSGVLRPGDNELEIDVFNTLAPLMGATSPTPFVFAGQRVSGLFGPVRLIRH